MITSAPSISLKESGIGNTPLIQLPADLIGGRRVFAKLEKHNPFGSIKDRAAWFMLAGAEARGELKPEAGTVIEATSGNTGIALAGFAAARNYRCIIVLPDSASAERLALLKFLGAEVVLTPASEGYVAAISEAERLQAQTPGAWFACQHENSDNVEAHFATTGPELWSDTNGEVSHFVCGVGTGGTISGAGRYLKNRRPDIRITAVEPERSPVLSGGAGGTHGIPGWNGGFVAPTTDVSVIDEVVVVSDEEAWAMTRDLARQGIFVGISSGAAAVAARRLRIALGDNDEAIVTIFPDSGERYISLLTA